MNHKSDSSIKNRHLLAQILQQRSWTLLTSVAFLSDDEPAHVHRFGHFQADAGTTEAAGPTDHIAHTFNGGQHHDFMDFVFPTTITEYEFHAPQNSGVFQTSNTEIHMPLSKQDLLITLYTPTRSNISRRK